MTHSSYKEQLLAIFENRLTQESADEVSRQLVEANVAPQALELLTELQDNSAKLAGGAIEALPEVLRRCDPQTVIPWLDLTIGLASHSGAVTLKYFRESPPTLGILESPVQRHQVLSTVLEIVDSDSEYAANCAFEFFRKTPELLFADPSIDLAGWAEVGQELTEWNQVLGIEFFRECVNVAQVLPLDEVRSWVAFGTKLITQNSLGKPDYVGILEFFRTSPSLLKEIDSKELRPRVVILGSTLADRSPETALTFLVEAPVLMKALPSPEWQTLVLQYGLLVAERDANVTLDYLRRCPEVVNVAVGSDEKHKAFETWFRGGMEVLDYSVDGARAYFALETDKALRSIEQAMNGVTLRQVARSLKLFAQMICGESVLIESLPEGGNQVHTETTAQGLRVRLPMVMNQYPTREVNLRCYTVMVAHEVGHLEFGTYQISSQLLQEMGQTVAARYLDEQKPLASIHTLDELFSLFPQKGVIKDLWTILEDARVEFLLQQEYPGLREDLAALAKASVSMRSFLHGMTAREMVLDALLLHLTDGAEAVHFQDELKPVIESCWTLAQSVLHPDAKTGDVLKVADQIYQVMEDMIGTYELPTTEPPPESQEDETDIGAGPRAAEETAGAYRPITNFAYRGDMSPELVQGDTESEEGIAPSGEKGPDLKEFGGASESSSSRADRSGKKKLLDEQPQKLSDGSPGQDRVLEDHWAVKDSGQGELPIQKSEERTFLLS